MTRLYWDFRGGRAHGTAEHFARHLEEFLSATALTGCGIGVEAYSAIHSAAYCDAPAKALPTIVERLQPRRRRTVPPGEDA